MHCVPVSVTASRLYAVSLFHRQSLSGSYLPSYQLSLYVHQVFSVASLTTWNTLPR